MACLDGDGELSGAWKRCDICGDDHDYRCGCDPYKHEKCEVCKPYYWQWMEISMYMWRDINRFEGRLRGGIPEEICGKDICRKCALRLVPSIQRFTDIAAVNTYNNRLRKAINERKRQEQE